MSIVKQNKVSLFIGLGIGIFCFVSIFGVWHVHNMEMKDGRTTGGCLFVNMEAICVMTFGEHIRQWQNTFITTVPQKAFAFVLLLWLAVTFVAISIFKRNLFLLFGYYVTHWRLYVRHNPEFSFFHPLREAFSRGVLHPKIY